MTSIEEGEGQFMGVECAIAVRQLCKDYPIAYSLGEVLRRPFARARRHRVLDCISFEITYGQVVGVVGLNGAGKTTLLKILCDLLSPDSGDVIVAGYSLPADGMSARSRIGYVPSDERSFFWRLSGRANLEFFASLYGLPAKIASTRIDELLDCFGLTNKADGFFRDYSSGMRKRLAITRGLLHDPQVLILDEPTNSLDPHWDRHLRDYISKWARDRQDRAVVWSTHRKDEISDICDSVLWLSKGRLQSHREANPDEIALFGGAGSSCETGFVSHSSASDAAKGREYSGATDDV